MPSGVDPHLYQQYQDRIIGLDDIEAWENIMKWINWIQAYIVYIANQDKRVRRRPPSLPAVPGQDHRSGRQKPGKTS